MIVWSEAHPRRVIVGENEGRADRAPQQENSDPPNHERDATLQWEAKVKKLVTQEVPSEPFKPLSCGLARR